MTAEYHYSRGGQQSGPVSPEQLKALAKSGDLQPSDLIWKEGMAEWLPASRMKGLFSSPVATVATPPPVPPTIPPTDERDSIQITNTGSRSASRDGQHLEDTARLLGKHAKESAILAGQDAMKAFKAMALNPVGGMRVAFDGLGPKRAMIVGVVFGIVFDVSVFLGVGMLVPRGMSGESTGLSVETLLKLIVLGLVPLAGATAGCAVVRKLFRGQGDIQSDIFIAGAALLPVGLGALAIGVVGLASVELIAAIVVFASTTQVLMLYSGCTTIQRIPDAAATLSVPLIFLVWFYASKVIMGSLLVH